MIQLKILSDPICPWCYIGKKALDKAKHKFPLELLNIVWMPFQLNPKMPKKGMERKVYLVNKFGSSDNAIKAYAPILERFNSCKIDCDFTKIKITPNTLDAQRLIHWAGIEGCQMNMVENLFKGYFLNGADIGNKEILISLGEMSGLSKTITKKLLESEEDKETILHIELKYRQAAVHGIPTYLINDDFVIPGAQTEEFWIKVLSEIPDRDKRR